MVEAPKPRQAAFFLTEGSGNFVTGSVPLDGNGEPLVGRRKQLDEARINSELAHQSLMEMVKTIEKARSLRVTGESLEGIEEVIEDSRLASRRYSDMLSEERSRIREEVNRIVGANGMDESKI